MKRIVVIGGGASGVLLAAHLLRLRRSDLTVTIVERAHDIGAGIAYGTAHPAHLLNVRASNMSAFPDQPDHFCRWLARSGRGAHGLVDPAMFASRRVYRDYLAHLLEPFSSKNGRAEGFTVVKAQATGILDRGEGVGVTLDDGSVSGADAVVLATGNEGPPLPPAPWRRDGWSDSAEPVASDARVVIVGSGLTMVDHVLALLLAGHEGPITALSRHGLTPNPHRVAQASEIHEADLPVGEEVSRMMRWLRHRIRTNEAAGGDWRSVIDALRPHTALLWGSLPTQGRLRFLRHARACWDVHRHRIAPFAFDHLARAKATGQLSLGAATILGFEEQAGAVRVAYRPRGSARREWIEADIVVECRGRASDVTRTVNPVLCSLLSQGRARPDPTLLGLDVTPHLALVDASGCSSSRIFAIGPLTSGVFWESTAVPDIRQQAACLAARLAG